MGVTKRIAESRCFCASWLVPGGDILVRKVLPVERTESASRRDMAGARCVRKDCFVLRSAIGNRLTTEIVVMIQPAITGTVFLTRTVNVIQPHGGLHSGAWENKIRKSSAFRSGLNGGPLPNENSAKRDGPHDGLREKASGANGGCVR